MLEHCLQDVACLARALDFEEGPGEKLAIMARRREIQPRCLGAIERRAQDRRGTGGVTHLGSECAQVELAAELPARLPGQPLGKVGGFRRATLRRDRDHELFDHLGVIGL